MRKEIYECDSCHAELGRDLATRWKAFKSKSLNTDLTIGFLFCPWNTKKFGLYRKAFELPDADYHFCNAKCAAQFFLTSCEWKIEDIAMVNHEI